MVSANRFHLDPFIVIADTVLQVADADAVTLRCGGMSAEMFADILAVRQEDVLRHVRQARRSDGIDWIRTPMNPGCEQEIGQAHGMIGVQVCHKQVCQASCVPSDFPVRLRLHDTLHDAVTAIDQVGLIIDHHRQARTHTFGFGIGCSAAQNHNLRSAHTGQSPRR